MQTLLVLTDFSEASSYAASYACVLARQLHASSIVLYHSYKAVVSPGASVVYEGDEDSLHRVAVDRLIELSASLRELVPQHCTIRYRADTGSLGEINIVTEEERADLIVMGTTGKGKLEALVAGSNAITVSETAVVPVVLVPANIPMNPVCELVFACDLKETDSTIPQHTIHKVIRSFHVPLTVLHVGSPDNNERKKLSAWLDVHAAVYEQVDSDDTAQGIIDFADRKAGALVLVVAKRRGFPSGLFHRSVTKQLAFQSTSPILVVREAETPVPVMPLLEI